MLPTNPKSDTKCATILVLFLSYFIYLSISIEDSCGEHVYTPSIGKVE